MLRVLISARKLSKLFQTHGRVCGGATDWCDAVNGVALSACQQPVPDNTTLIYFIFNASKSSSGVNTARMRRRERQGRFPSSTEPLYDEGNEHDILMNASDFFN